MTVLEADLEKYLFQILEQSKNGIIISDPNQEGNPVIYVNETTCNKFEYTKDDFLGRNCSFLQANDKNQSQIKQISQAIKKRQSITTTIRNYTKSGKLIHNQFTISPIFDDENKLKYFLGIQRDVTKEVLLTQENEVLQEEKIDNAQYTAIGKLSAGISHEINTPLTIIKGNIEMLKSSIETLENSQIKEYMFEDLQLIENNLKRIKNVTESMREIADTHNFKFEEINLYRAVVIPLRLTYNRSKIIANINLQNENFNLDIDRENKKYTIKGDAQKLEQAFIAIIDNALDQLEINGSINENLLNINILEDDANYQLVFHDNAGGIDEQLLPNIFKPFKGDKKHKGLGIGLSVVKKIIDKHQFKINIKNFDQGVKVIITIPKKL